MPAAVYSEQLDEPFDAVTDAGGRCVVVVKTRRLQTWEVAQVTVEMPGILGGTCALRKNGHLVSPLIAFQDAAGGDPPVTLRPSDVLTVEWTGAPVGVRGRVLVLYRQVTYR